MLSILRRRIGRHCCQNVRVREMRLCPCWVLGFCRPLPEALQCTVDGVDNGGRGINAVRVLLRAASYSDSDNIAFSRLYSSAHALLFGSNASESPPQPVYCAKICCSSSLAGTPPLATRCSISFSFWMAALLAQIFRAVLSAGYPDRGFIGNGFTVVGFIFCRKPFCVRHNLCHKGAGFFDDLAIDGFNKTTPAALVDLAFGADRAAFLGLAASSRKFFMANGALSAGNFHPADECFPCRFPPR